MDFDYKTLMLLRQNTFLDPISYFKILKERRYAEEYQVVMNKIERCSLGVDYSKADALEANLRFKIWCEKVFPLWYKYGRQEEIESFAERVLFQNDRSDKPKRILKR